MYSKCHLGRAASNVLIDWVKPHSMTCGNLMPFSWYHCFWIDPLARGNVPSRAPRWHGTRRGNTCHQQRHFQGCEAHLELTCEFLEDGPWFNPTCVLRPASDLSRMDEQTNRVFIEHFISTEMGLRLRTPWKPRSSLPSSSLRLQRLLHSELEGNKAGVPVLWSECFMPQIRVLKSQPPVMASGGGPFRRS